MLVVMKGKTLILFCGQHHPPVMNPVKGDKQEYSVTGEDTRFLGAKATM